MHYNVPRRREKKLHILYAVFVVIPRLLVSVGITLGSYQRTVIYF